MSLSRLEAVIAYFGKSRAAASGFLEDGGSVAAAAVVEFLMIQSEVEEEAKIKLRRKLLRDIAEGYGDGGKRVTVARLKNVVEDLLGTSVSEADWSYVCAEIVRRTAIKSRRTRGGWSSQLQASKIVKHKDETNRKLHGATDV